jgi:hypothetical protein
MLAIVLKNSGAVEDHRLPIRGVLLLKLLRSDINFDYRKRSMLT